MFIELNPLLHSELRLAVMSILVSVEEAEFSDLKQQTGATAGNPVSYTHLACTTCLFILKLSKHLAVTIKSLTFASAFGNDRCV